MSTTKVTRALSIRQPYAEQILRGTKRIEYRSRPVNLRERVHIYAAMRPGDADSFAAVGKRPGELPTGCLVGTVEIVGCTRHGSEYHWHLARPKRADRPLRPRQQPQPAFFYPFATPGNERAK